MYIYWLTSESSYRR